MSKLSPLEKAQYYLELEKVRTNKLANNNEDLKNLVNSYKLRNKRLERAMRAVRNDLWEALDE